MSNTLHWQRQQHCLQLSGELTASTLLPLWSNREQLMQDIHLIDIQQLKGIDSAGLALLLHLALLVKSAGKQLALRGASDNLYRLIQLYHLPSSLFSYS